MNFEHTEDRRMLSDMLRRFVAEQYDIATRHRNAGAERGHSPEFWRRYAELGAIGALFAERDGGLGGAGFDIAVVFEALGRGLVIEPFLDALMVGSAIAQAGTPAQRESLDGLIAGARVAALAAPSRMPATSCRASRPAPSATARAGGCTGPAVVNAGGHADLYLVSARTSGAGDEEDGISLFLVEASAPGLSARGARWSTAAARPS